MLNTGNIENGNNKDEIQHVSHFLDKTKEKIKIQVNKKESINALAWLVQSGLLPPRLWRVLEKAVQKAILDDSTIDDKDKIKQLKEVQYRDLFTDVLWENHKFDYNRWHWMTQEVIVWKNGYYKARVKSNNRTERVLYLKPNGHDLPRLKDSWLKDLQVVVHGVADESKAFLQFLGAK